jgi:serine O-acetyltransferase
MDSKDPIWDILRREARETADREPFLKSFVDASILLRQNFEDALAMVLAQRLSEERMASAFLHSLFHPMLRHPEIASATRRDLQAVVERDPAAAGLHVVPFLNFKGFQALQAHRISHALWNSDRKDMAFHMQSRIATTFGVDFHPAARIGSGILIDHATGVVVGETAVIGDGVSMLHGVTLGGTGKASGDRHPKVGNGVLLGAGAKILGNIRIGEGSKVGAGSVVLADVPPHVTVVGVPARIVGRPHVASPGLDMDQQVEVDESMGYEI